MVRAASAVSASAARSRAEALARAMKSGTAKRGGAPMSPLEITVLISLGCCDAGGVAGGCCADSARPANSAMLVSKAFGHLL